MANTTEAKAKKKDGRGGRRKGAGRNPDKVDPKTGKFIGDKVMAAQDAGLVKARAASVAKVTKGGHTTQTFITFMTAADFYRFRSITPFERGDIAMSDMAELRRFKKTFKVKLHSPFKRTYEIYIDGKNQACEITFTDKSHYEIIVQMSPQNRLEYIENSDGAVTYEIVMPCEEIWNERESRKGETQNPPVWGSVYRNPRQRFKNKLAKELWCSLTSCERGILIHRAFQKQRQAGKLGDAMATAAELGEAEALAAEQMADQS